MAFVVIVVLAVPVWITCHNANRAVGHGDNPEQREDGSPTPIPAETVVAPGQGFERSGDGERQTNETPSKADHDGPGGRVSVKHRSSNDSGPPEPEVLRKIVTAYMSGIKRCHQELLERAPSASGTVDLRLTVGESGRVVRAEVDGFDPGVDRCIERRARTWRFALPKGSDGAPAEATFKVSLVLQAG